MVRCVDFVGIDPLAAVLTHAFWEMLFFLQKHLLLVDPSGSSMISQTRLLNFQLAVCYRVLKHPVFSSCYRPLSTLDFRVERVCVAPFLFGVRSSAAQDWFSMGASIWSYPELVVWRTIRTFKRKRWPKNPFRWEARFLRMMPREPAQRRVRIRPNKNRKGNARSDSFNMVASMFFRGAAQKPCWR